MDIELIKAVPVEDKPVRVLLIEDSPLEARFVEESLKGNPATKFDLVRAASMAAALLQLDEKEFDLILLDLLLPDSSGYESFATIFDKGKGLPVIVMTGQQDEAIAVRAVRNGAQDYLIKGFVDARMLPRHLIYALERKRTEIELKNSKEELEIQAWGLKKANEGIKILYKDLEQKNTQLYQLSNIKSQFVANVSHEFKNPLSIIKEALAIVLEGGAGPVTDRQKEWLLASKCSAERLIRLVTDLLDISKIEAGRMDLKREEMDIGVLAGEIAALYEHEAAKKKNGIALSILQGVPPLWADRDKISEVIINLLTNAIKYTPQGGRVVISIEGSPQEVRVEVADNGPGIPADYIGKVFEKFERVAGVKEEGTGLGLPIAKDIIELHKGKLWVESRPGQGSRFIFTLPRDLRNQSK
ncbi:MAG: ATP-binding protein [Candidatus Omnitrophota bacterium]